jgi:hypothetical protein
MEPKPATVSAAGRPSRALGNQETPPVPTSSKGEEWTRDVGAGPSKGNGKQGERQPEGKTRIYQLKWNQITNALSEQNFRPKAPRNPQVQKVVERVPF